MSNWGYTEDTAPPDLRDAYRWLAPDPNLEYGDVLPYAIDRTTGKLHWPRLSSSMRDTLGGFLDLMAGLDTGEVTPRASAAITLGGLGAGASLAPRGATLAAGGARFGADELRDGLKMDYASRMARAKEMGFNIYRLLFHGTDGPDFGAFRVAPPWEVARSARPPGVSLAENPAVANKFSEPRARSPLGLSPTSHDPRFQEGLPRTYPLLARFDKSANLMLRPGDDWGDIWRSVAGAFDQGYDAIRLHNYTMFPDLGPQINWMIRDPNQLRSPFAAFDPAKRGSSDLLAGFVAPIGPVPPGFNVQPEQSDPQMAARAAWLRRRNEVMTPAPGLASWRPPEPKSEPVRMMRLPTGQLVDEATVPNNFRPLHRQVY